MMPAEADLLDARILVVDDKAANVLLLEQLLASVGYRHVSACMDPHAVCELHRLHHYDLILLDLQMPGMDGFEVMAGLQGIEPDGYMPVLAITVQPSHKLRALRAGAKDFVAKPFELAELTTRIHNLLEVRLLYRQLAQAARSLEAIALHDALTGLPNRRLLMDRLQQCRQSVAQQHQHAALMFLDLDHFKQLNDTLGHDVGDVLLQQVSARLQSCLREGDSVARFGGDEFVVLLVALNAQPAAAASQAAAVAQKILQVLGQGYLLQGHAYDNTVSIGIVVFLGEVEPVSHLLKMADMAMYRAKTLGRYQVCFFDPAMQAQAQAQDALVKDLHQALNAHELALHYQLQVDASGLPVGAEALLCWHHAQHERLAPLALLALAEDAGLVLPLTQWLLEAACAQLRAWASDPQTASWTLAVNVADNQLAQPDFVAQLTEVLHTSGAAAQRLTLVLTEAALQTDVDDAIAKIMALRAIGVGFCLADMSAGFGLLGVLKRLPLRQLKVDQAMVQAACSDASVAVIARAIVALAASLALPVWVAGVENAAQREFFAQLGCQVFQGDFFAAAALPGALLISCKKKLPLAL
jgi:diguanylate cyclase (GGDEF)-like protein